MAETKELTVLLQKKKLAYGYSYEVPNCKIFLSSKSIEYCFICLHNSLQSEKLNSQN